MSNGSWPPPPTASYGNQEGYGPAGYVPTADRIPIIRVLVWTGIAFEFVVTVMQFVAEKHSAFAMLTLAVSALYLLIYIAGGIAYLSWLVSIVRNANALAPNANKLSGSGSILDYFFPIICIYRPYLTMRQIVKESVKGYDGQRGVVQQWWWLWILAGTIGLFDGSLAWSAPGNVALSAIVSLVDLVLTVASAVYFMRVLEMVSSGQDAMYESMRLTSIG